MPCGSTGLDYAGCFWRQTYLESASDRPPLFCPEARTLSPVSTMFPATEAQHICSLLITSSTTTTTEQWIQLITIAAETNAACKSLFKHLAIYTLYAAWWIHTQRDKHRDGHTQCDSEHHNTLPAY